MKVTNTVPVRVQGYELKSFKNDKGETIEFAKALIIDEGNKVIEVKAGKELKHLEVDCPIDNATCDFEFFESETKEGKKFFKLKLVKVEGYEA